MSALANHDEIQSLAHQGAIFYVSHSGGKDSQAMYLAICKIVPHNQIRAIHADLGDIEHAGVKKHIIGNLTHSSELRIAQAFDKCGEAVDLFDMIRRRRTMLDAKGKTEASPFPSSAARFCTSDLKTGPIWREIRRDGHPIVVNCVGIRAEESNSRAKKVGSRGTLNLNKKNTNGKRQAYDWWPIADWTIEQVWDEISDAGQQPHPVYASGNDRLSCVFCIFGSPNDLRNGRQARPDLYQRYIDLEIEVRSTMYNGQSLSERVAA